MSIKMLWVESSGRNGGIGSRLLHMVEEYEISQGIFHSHLETMQFQAREFYKDHCYLVFVSLENKPNPHTWYYIKKDLLPNSDQ